MALFFDQVQLLRYDHTPIFFGAGLRYRIEKKFTITGILLSLTNQDGVGVIATKENQTLTGATDYDDIYLNGVLFGQGKINNVSFGGGNLVRQEAFSYDIVCYEDGNLFNATAGVYAGISWANARRIDSLSESLSFQEDADGNKTYSHSVSVRFCEGTPAQEINLAKAIAAELFSATSGLGAFLGVYNLTGLKKYYNESYDLVSGACSFDENCIIPANRSGNYSAAFSYKVELGTDGYTNVTETVSIQGLATPILVSALEGYNALIGGSYTRSNAVYTAYGFSSLPLFTQPITKGVTTNKFLGTIEFSLVFSNNPKYQNSAIWEYSITSDKNKDNLYTVSESGSVIGLGRAGVEKYSNAYTFYTDVVKAGIDARLLDIYTRVGGTHPLFLIGSNFGKNEFAGKITYSITKTDDSLYSDGNIKKTEFTIDLSRPTHLSQKYTLFNVKEIVQSQGQATEGKVYISIRMKGKRGTPISEFLTACSVIVAPYTNLGQDEFLNQCQYSYNPNTAEFSLNAEYLFTGLYKELTDLTLT